MKKTILRLLLLSLMALVGAVSAGECDNWKTLHPEWIFCDDFDSTSAFVRNGRYFEYDNNAGDFAPLDNAGLDSSRGMRELTNLGLITVAG